MGATKIIFAGNAEKYRSVIPEELQPYGLVSICEPANSGLLSLLINHFGKLKTVAVTRPFFLRV